MFKIFIAFVICFAASFGISQINTVLEWPSFPYALVAAVVAGLFAKIVGWAFGLNKEVGEGSRRRDGSFVSMSMTNVGALLAAGFAFVFSLLG